MSEPSAAFDALGDRNRRAILELLSRGPSSVHALAEQLPISRPAVSRHLRLLKEADLVVAQASGSQRLYSLRVEGVIAMRDYFAELWGEAAIRFRITAENLADSDKSANLADSDKSANLADDEKRLGSTTHE